MRHLQRTALKVSLGVSLLLTSPAWAKKVVTAHRASLTALTAELIKRTPDSPSRYKTVELAIGNPHTDAHYQVHYRVDGDRVKEFTIIRLYWTTADLTILEQKDGKFIVTGANKIEVRPRRIRNSEVGRLIREVLDLLQNKSPPDDTDSGHPLPGDRLAGGGSTQKLPTHSRPLQRGAVMSG